MSTRFMCVAFCEQTHARCQGFAADDHIHKECHTISVTPEQEKQITDLVSKIDQCSTEELNDTCEAWMEANPDETECLAEGDEFIGLTWVEVSAYDGVSRLRDPAEPIIKQLQEILATKEADHP